MPGIWFHYPIILSMHSNSYTTVVKIILTVIPNYYPNTKSHPLKRYNFSGPKNIVKKTCRQFSYNLSICNLNSGRIGTIQDINNKN